MKVLLIACLVLMCAAAVSADVVYPAALTLEPGYAIGPEPGFPWWAYPSLGSQLTWVGRVAAVGRPFDDLLPSGNYEITYVFEGSTCVTVGNWDSFSCSGGGEFGDFQGGTVAFFLDSSPDADFVDLSTFHDGDLVLLAQSSYTYVLDDDPHVTCPWVPDQPDVTSFFRIVGGTWFDRVSNQGVGFDGVCRGELDANVPAELQELAYVFRADGLVDIYGSVPVASTTWGRIKAMYR